MTTGDELDQFVEEMLTASEFSDVSENVHAQLVSDLKEELVNQINRALINALPDDKIDQLNALLDDENVNNAQIEQLIADSGVDTKDVAMKTMLRFRDSYIQPETQELE